MGPTKPTRAATDQQNGGLRLYKPEKRNFGVLNDPGLPKNAIRHGEAISFVNRRVSNDLPRFEIFAKSPQIELKIRRRSAKRGVQHEDFPGGSPILVLLSPKHA